MSDAVWTALIGGAAGLASGVAGSIFAPWSQWGVEKRRATRDERKELVAKWRAGLAAWEQTSAADPRVIGAGRSGEPLLSNSDWYLTFARFASDETRKLVQDMERDRLPLEPVTVTLGGSLRSEVAVSIQDDIDRCAQKWKVF